MEGTVLTLEKLETTLTDYKGQIEKSLNDISTKTGDNATKEIKALTADLIEVQKSLKSVEEQLKVAASRHVPGMKDEAKKWSWTSFMRAADQRRKGANEETAFKDAGIEKEMLDAAMEKRSVELRTANVAGDGSLGGYLIPPEISDEVIDMAIANMPIMQMGVTQIRGLYGDLPIPKKTARTTAYMVGESEKPPESNVTYGEAKLTPHKAAAFTKQSNRLIYQSRGVSDQIIKADLSDAMSLKMEQQFLNGSGAGKQTKGLFQHTGFTTSSVALGGNGGRFRFDNAASMIQDLEEADEYKNGGSYGFLMRPKVKWGMKRERVEQYSGQGNAAGMPVLGMNLLMSDEMLKSQLGCNIQTTTLIGGTDTAGTSTTTSKVLFGNWKLFYIAMWRDLILKISDVAGDGSTGSAFLDDQIYIVMFQEFDNLVMREAAFTMATGAECTESKW